MQGCQQQRTEQHEPHHRCGVAAEGRGGPLLQPQGHLDAVVKVPARIRGTQLGAQMQWHCIRTCARPRGAGLACAFVSGPALIRHKTTTGTVGVQCRCKYGTGLPVPANCMLVGLPSGSWWRVRQQGQFQQVLVLTAHACGGGRSLERSTTPGMTFCRCRMPISARSHICMAPPSSLLACTACSWWCPS